MAGWREVSWARCASLRASLLPVTIIVYGVDWFLWRRDCSPSLNPFAAGASSVPAGSRRNSEFARRILRWPSCFCIKTETTTPMKISKYVALGLLVVSLTPVFSQQLPITRVDVQLQNDTSQKALTKFNLDFPGGTPAQLVKAIEKAMGKPLNVIILDEAASIKLPPVKASDLDVAKLFKTLSDNSKKYSNNELISQYSFVTIDEHPSDNSLWTFGSYTKTSTLARFDLDFPGGTPAQLVKTIEKAMGKPLNVIINKEDENIELPPLKMNDVYLPQLFSALEAASRKVVAVSTGAYGGSHSQFSSGYGFKSADNDGGDSAVWYFHVEKPTFPPVVSTQKICKFYPLAEYLNQGLTVDDITTAIQTGWK